MTVTVKTDHKWRDLVYRTDVPETILRSEFGYQDPEEVTDGYFRYRGHWYHLDDFMTLQRDSPLQGWDGYKSDSYFSGVVIKLSDDYEHIKLGTYIS